MTKRSFRSTGASWGLAEEAARVMRHFAQYEFGEHIRILLGLLKKIDQKPYTALCPDAVFMNATLANFWQARQGHLCPIVSGALLSDCAQFLPAKITLKSIYYPCLLLPALTFIARDHAIGFRFMMDPLSFWVLPNSVHYKNLTSEILLTSVMVGTVIQKGTVSQIKNTIPSAAKLLAASTLLEVTAENWAELNACASKTHVPATLESRLKGAGTSISDND